jgi:hypothetical protein
MHNASGKAEGGGCGPLTRIDDEAALEGVKRLPVGCDQSPASIVLFTDFDAAFVQECYSCARCSVS